ncbi:MAG: hypothetical protein ACLQVJ_19455 [Syntrophobacteraceae bacterium]
MNKKLFSLSIFTIALAMAFVFSAPNVTRAASDNYNDQFVGITNLLGVDEAHNGAGARDRDRAPVVNFQTYGLQGDWAGQH